MPFVIVDVGVGRSLVGDVGVSTGPTHLDVLEELLLDELDEVRTMPLLICGSSDLLRRALEKAAAHGDPVGPSIPLGAYDDAGSDPASTLNLKALSPYETPISFPEIVSVFSVCAGACLARGLHRMQVALFDEGLLGRVADLATSLKLCCSRGRQEVAIDGIVA